MKPGKYVTLLLGFAGLALITTVLRKLGLRNNARFRELFTNKVSFGEVFSFFGFNT